MRITVSFPPGFKVEGFVLSLHGNSMRVAMRNWDDATVFQFAGGRWLAENGDPCRVYTPEQPAGIAAYAHSTGYENSVAGLSPLRAFSC